MGQRYRTMEDQKPWLGFAQEGFGKGKWSNFGEACE